MGWIEVIGCNLKLQLTYTMGWIEVISCNLKLQITYTMGWTVVIGCNLNVAVILHYPSLLHQLQTYISLHSQYIN